MKTNFASLLSLLVICCLLAGCGPLTVVDVAISALEAAVPLIPSSELSVADKATANAWLAQAQQGVNCVVNELATSDTGAQRDLAVAACLTGLNYAGLPPTVAAILASVNAAIQGILKYYSTNSTAAVETSKLPALRARLAAVQAKLAGGSH